MWLQVGNLLRDTVLVVAFSYVTGARAEGGDWGGIQSKLCLRSPWGFYGNAGAVAPSREASQRQRSPSIYFTHASGTLDIPLDDMGRGGLWQHHTSAKRSELSVPRHGQSGDVPPGRGEAGENLCVKNFTDELWFNNLHQCLAHEDSDSDQSTDKITLNFMYSAPLNPPHQRPTRKREKRYSQENTKTQQIAAAKNDMSSIRS